MRGRCWIVIRIKAGSDERDVWPIRNRILDMHRKEKTGWPEKLKKSMNPRNKPSVTEMGRLLRWLKKMNVTEYIKVEWRPPCSTMVTLWRRSEQEGGNISLC